MKEKERNYTEAEKKRWDAFEQKRLKLIEQGYKDKEMTVGLVKANIFAIILTMVYAVIASIVYFQVNENTSKLFSFNMIELFIFVIGMAVMIVIHELIHGLVWEFFLGKNLKILNLGLSKSMLLHIVFVVVN